MGRAVILGIDALEFAIGERLRDEVLAFFHNLELAQVVMENKLAMKYTDLEPSEQKLLNQVLIPVGEIPGLEHYHMTVSLQFKIRQQFIRELQHRIELRRDTRDC